MTFITLLHVFVLQISECGKLNRGQGEVIPCLIEHKANVSSASCKQFLTKMASIVFGDYRLIKKLTDSCNGDIQRLTCGRLDNDEDDVSTCSCRFILT